MILEEEKKAIRTIARTLIDVIVEEIVSQGVRILADEIKRKSVEFDSESETSKAHEAWSAHCDWNSYKDGWLDCASSREIK